MIPLLHTSTKAGTGFLSPFGTKRTKLKMKLRPFRTASTSTVFRSAPPAMISSPSLTSATRKCNSTSFISGRRPYSSLLNSSRSSGRRFKNHSSFVFTSVPSTHVKTEGTPLLFSGLSILNLLLFLLSYLQL